MESGTNWKISSKIYPNDRNISAKNYPNHPNVSSKSGTKSLNISSILYPNMAELNEIIEILNPWWKEQTVNPELAKLYQRKVFAKLHQKLSYRQIILISGLRRVGKTTLIYQLIKELLKDYDSKHILYFNFDRKSKELIDIFDKYQELTGIEWKKEKIVVFLDEIAKLTEWSSQIKLIYDSFPNIKLILSSSSSVWLEDEAIKTLAGRYFITTVKPLSFAEFLELKGKSKYLDNLSLWQKEIEQERKRYMLRCFPETIEWEDELMIKDYMRSTIIDKVVKEDLPDKFKNLNKDLLFTLIRMIYSEPGIHIDYDAWSQKLGVNKKSLTRHIFYLEFSYLIRRVKNFRMSVSATSRKLQRAYPYWWALAYSYDAGEDKLMENIVASIADAEYYWRKNEKEIDFLKIKDKKIIPIEVKNKEELSKDDFRHLKYFLTKYKLKEGCIIYMGKEGKIEGDGYVINLIPLWRWLLEEKN